MSPAGVILGEMEHTCRHRNAQRFPWPVAADDGDVSSPPSLL